MNFDTIKIRESRIWRIFIRLHLDMSNLSITPSTTTACNPGPSIIIFLNYINNSGKKWIVGGWRVIGIGLYMISHWKNFEQAAALWWFYNDT